MATEERSSRKFKIGLVVSDKADKTITVKIERRVPHKLYQKYYRRTKKFLVHDPENSAGEGDRVKIMECRPLSKNKSWRLVEILERAR